MNPNVAIADATVNGRGSEIAVTNPATGEIVGRDPDTGAREVERLINRARSAQRYGAIGAPFGGWNESGVGARHGSGGGRGS
jgi:acyl-CoA reductase-like NAD-dependent aldehyde dehydrogenase